MAQVLQRTMPTTLEREDRRTLLCRYVPFDVTAVAVDTLPDGSLERYHEQFKHGVFNRQIEAAGKAGGVLQRITLIDEHTSEGGSKLGFTVAMRQENDGVYGAIRLLPSRVDDVDALMDEGVDRLSVEFIPHRGGTRVTPDGVKQRCDAHLLKVAMVPEGAYDGSQVLAMREAEDLVVQVASEYQAQVDDLDAYLAAETARQQEWAARLTG